jgi:hypothetical protein
MPFNKLDETSAGKIRPRFKLESPVPKEELMEVVIHYLKQDDTLVFNTYQRFIKISVPSKDQHYWSPLLSLSFNQEKGRTLIRGVIGPKESIWTMFMFFYISLAVAGFFGSMYALVKWQINDDKSFLVIIPIVTILLLSVFYTSKYGKTEAHTQTLHLLRALRKAVDTVECTRVEE